MDQIDNVYGGSSKVAVAQRLTLTREFLGLKQKEVGSRAGITASAYNHIEAATSYPSVETAIRLAKAFRLTLDWIYMGDPSGLPYELADGIYKSYSSRTKLKGLD
jgi:transcriptional regulator with XRE-family HTH domain